MLSQLFLLPLIAAYCPAFKFFKLQGHSAHLDYTLVSKVVVFHSWGILDSKEVISIKISYIITVLDVSKLPNGLIVDVSAPTSSERHRELLWIHTPAFHNSTQGNQE